MKLEVGKIYKDRSGDMVIITGIIKPRSDRTLSWYQGEYLRARTKYPIRHYSWQSNGHYTSSVLITDTLDLIEEVTDPVLKALYEI